MARIILIDDSVYELTEKQFKELQKTRENKTPLTGSWENEVIDFLDKNKESYRYLGEIWFDIKH